jgi:hypothetical protein
MHIKVQIQGCPCIINFKFCVDDTNSAKTLRLQYFGLRPSNTCIHPHFVGIVLVFWLSLNLPVCPCHVLNVCLFVRRGHLSKGQVQDHREKDANKRGWVREYQRWGWMTGFHGKEGAWNLKLAFMVKKEFSRIVRIWWRFKGEGGGRRGNHS